MIVTLLEHRLIATLLLALLLNTSYAQEQDAASSEPELTATTVNTEPSSSNTNTGTESEPANEEQTAQEAPKSDSDKSSENKGEITRAQFTTAIADREPTDDIVMLTNDHDKIYFFTELVGFNGQTIKHRWEYNGKEVADVEFKVEGQRWRVHSSKNIQPEWIGIWNVVVLDQDNNVLNLSSFEVVDAKTNSSP